MTTVTRAFDYTVRLVASIRSAVAVAAAVEARPHPRSAGSAPSRHRPAQRSEHGSRAQSGSGRDPPARPPAGSARGVSAVHGLCMPCAWVLHAPNTLEPRRRASPTGPTKRVASA